MQPLNSWSEQRQQQWAKARERGEKRYLMQLCLPSFLVILVPAVGTLSRHGEHLMLEVAAMLVGLSIGLAMVVSFGRRRWRENEAAFVAYSVQSKQVLP